MSRTARHHHIAIAAWTLAPAVALAHVESGAAESGAGWHFTPDIVLLTLLAVALYLAGLWRLRGRETFPSAWRSAGFLGGVMLVFLALESPLDALSEHLFFMHQIQHFLLHSAGPMLVMLAAPQGPLLAGSPPVLRHYVIGPVMANGPGF